MQTICPLVGWIVEILKVNVAGGNGGVTIDFGITVLQANIATTLARHMINQ